MSGAIKDRINRWTWKKIMNGSQIYTRDRCANISEFSVGSGPKIIISFYSTSSFPWIPNFADSHTAPLVIQTQNCWLLFSSLPPDPVSPRMLVWLLAPSFAFSLLLLSPSWAVCCHCAASQASTALLRAFSSLVQDIQALTSGFNPLACESLEDEALAQSCSKCGPPACASKPTICSFSTMRYV